MKVDRALLRQTVPGRWWLTASIALAVLQAICLTAQAYLISTAIGAVFLGSQGLPQLQDEMLWFLVLSILRLILNTLAKVFATHAAVRVKFQLRSRLVQHIYRSGPVLISAERGGELVHTAQEGIESLDAYISEYLPQIALAGLIPLTMIAFILPLDLTSALVLLVTAPLIPVFMVLIGDTAEDISRRQWKSLGDLSARFLDALQGLSTLKLFGQSKTQAARLRQLGEIYRRTTMRVLRVAFLSALVLELVATISTAIVAVQVGLRLLYGRLVFEQALFVLILAPEFYLPLRTLGAKFHAGISGAVALERVVELLHLDLGTEQPPRELTSVIVETAPHIEFNDVFVQFQRREHPALDGVTLTLAPGSLTALVGPTGSGKSTIAHLLLRFLDATHGEILIDGVAHKRIDPEVWRRSIAWIPQKPYLFNTSVLHNLRMASPQASTERVEWSARQAHAHEFITRLPEGYQTMIGEDGLALSIGQAQRIALARAFLKDAPLIILDEATAHLDPRSEKALTASIERLSSDRTTLMIAHRLDTIRSADQIVVLASGAILESGKHDELIQSSGVYARLHHAYRGAP